MSTSMRLLNAEEDDEDGSDERRFLELEWGNLPQADQLAFLELAKAQREVERQIIHDTQRKLAGRRRAPASNTARTAGAAGQGGVDVYGAPRVIDADKLARLLRASGASDEREEFLTEVAQAAVRLWGNRWYQAALAAVIVAACACYIRRTYLVGPPYPRGYAGADGFFLVAFAFDLILNAIAATDVLAYFASPGALVDALVLLPPLLTLLAGHPVANAGWLFFFKAVRSWRSLRLHFLTSRLGGGDDGSSAAHLGARAQEVLFWRKLVSLAVYVSALLLVSAGVVVALESRNPGGFGDGEGSFDGMGFGFGGGLYFIIITMTTIGYGDVVPVSDAARFVVALAVVIFFVAVPCLVVEAAPTLGTASRHAGRHRLGNVRERHIVICGSVSFENLRTSLRELYHKDHAGQAAARWLRVVVLVPEEPDPAVAALMDLPEFRNQVSYIKGTPLSHVDLGRAAAEEAAGVMILVSKLRPGAESRAEDMRVTLMALSVLSHVRGAVAGASAAAAGAGIGGWRRKGGRGGAVPGGTALMVEVNNPSSAVHLRAAGIRHVVSNDEVKLLLLGQSCQCPGWSTLVCNMLRSHGPLPAEAVEQGAWIAEYYIGETLAEDGAAMADTGCLCMPRIDLQSSSLQLSVFAFQCGGLAWFSPLNLYHPSVPSGALKRPFSVEFSPQFLGQTFADAAAEVFERFELTLLAVESEKNGLVYINPGDAYRITEGDRAFVLAETLTAALSVWEYLGEVHLDTAEGEEAALLDFIGTERLAAMSADGFVASLDSSKVLARSRKRRPADAPPSRGLLEAWARVFETTCHAKMDALYAELCPLGAHSGRGRGHGMSSDGLGGGDGGADRGGGGFGGGSGGGSGARCGGRWDVDASLYADGSRPKAQEPSAGPRKASGAGMTLPIQNGEVRRQVSMTEPDAGGGGASAAAAAAAAAATTGTAVECGREIVGLQLGSWTGDLALEYLKGVQKRLLAGAAATNAAPVAEAVGTACVASSGGLSGGSSGARGRGGGGPPPFMPLTTARHLRGHVVVTGFVPQPSHLAVFLWPLRCAWRNEASRLSVVFMAPSVARLASALERLGRDEPRLDLSRVFLLPGQPVSQRDLENAGVATAAVVLCLTGSHALEGDPAASAAAAATTADGGGRAGSAAANDMGAMADIETMIAFTKLQRLCEAEGGSSSGGGTFVGGGIGSRGGSGGAVGGGGAGGGANCNVRRHVVVELKHESNIRFLHAHDSATIVGTLSDLGGDSTYLWPKFAAGAAYLDSALDALLAQAFHRPSRIALLERILRLGVGNGHPGSARRYGGGANGGSGGGTAGIDDEDGDGSACDGGSGGRAGRSSGGGGGANVNHVGGGGVDDRCSPEQDDGAIPDFSSFRYCDEDEGDSVGTAATAATAVAALAEAAREVGVHMIDVPLELVRYSFGELFQQLAAPPFRAIALGLYRPRGTRQSPEPYVYTGCRADTVLREGDRVYVLGRALQMNSNKVRL